MIAVKMKKRNSAEESVEKGARASGWALQWRRIHVRSSGARGDDFHPKESTPNAPSSVVAALHMHAGRGATVSCQNDDSEENHTKMTCFRRDQTDTQNHRPHTSDTKTQPLVFPLPPLGGSAHPWVLFRTHRLPNRARPATSKTGSRKHWTNTCGSCLSCPTRMQGRLGR